MRLAIGKMPSEPMLIKCRIKQTVGTLIGVGNPVSQDYKKEFPILNPDSRYNHIYIPGVTDEDGNRNQDLSSADSIDLFNNLEVLDIRSLL